MPSTTSQASIQPPRAGRARRLTLLIGIGVLLHLVLFSRAIWRILGEMGSRLTSDAPGTALSLLDSMLSELLEFVVVDVGLPVFVVWVLIELGRRLARRPAASRPPRRRFLRAAAVGLYVWLAVRAVLFFLVPEA